MRALRAEAEAAYANGLAMSAGMRYEALNRRLREVEGSRSWRLTRPLRTVAQRLRRRGARGTPHPT